MKLMDRVALVTGAGRGIGRAIALALAREGCHVAVNYRASQVGACEAVEEIRNLGRRALAIRADVSREDEVHLMRSYYGIEGQLCALLS